ncbi:kelch-like protein 1 [Arctopsyche grandis]|uniref:kelch-like protein 1 n=1 Tax=Arctopsyche grandis TaxID=121162 RepID=UPI00406D891B
MNDYEHHAQMQYGFSHMQWMQIFYTQRMYCDVDLIIRNKRYSTHKCILHMASALFRQKLEQNTRELVMDCEGIRQKSLVKAIEFLYKGTLELRIDEVANIVKLAELWQLNELKNYCYSFLDRVCRESRTVSQRFETIDNYFLNNFSKIVNHERFLSLPVDNMERLLLSNDLQVSSEEQAFKGLSQWIKHDWVNRRNYLYPLLKCIRLPFCSISFLLEEVTSLCCKSIEENQFSILLDALKWHQMPEKRSSLTLMNSQSRNKNNQVLILGGDSPNISGLIEAYNPTTNLWTDFFKTDIKNTLFSAEIFQNTIFLFGGWNFNEKNINKVYSINLLTKQLSELSPMKEKRSNSTAAIVNQRIFVIGGSNSVVNAMNTVEEYNYVENKWNSAASMNVKRYNHASVVYNDNIYVFGGHNGKDILNSVEVYNTKTKKWKILKPMESKRKELAAVVINDSIYCIGGSNSYSTISEVERYDPRSNTWTKVKNSPKNDHELRAISHNGKIICFGGEFSRSVQEYDPENDQWRIIGDMPKKRPFYNALIADLNL